MTQPPLIIYSKVEVNRDGGREGTHNPIFSYWCGLFLLLHFEKEGVL